MTIPDYQSLMLPLLKLVRDKKEHTYREVIESLSDQAGLSTDERRELLPSGNEAIFDNRVRWAVTYLRKAILLESPRRGCFKITKRGLQVLKEGHTEIGVKFLTKFDEFVEFRRIRKKAVSGRKKPFRSHKDTPEEALESAYQDLRNEIASELLRKVRAVSPVSFERIVVDLLLKIGYGGSRQDAGRAIGQSGDEGIDGIIKEDRLGLDIVYIQAKRWENTVGRPEVQKFAGALQGQRAKKGIFISTANFSRAAEEYASSIETKIVLIDGEQLVQLMIDNDVGVAPVSSYEVKRIDSDYFGEE